MRPTHGWCFGCFGRFLFWNESELIDALDRYKIDASICDQLRQEGFLRDSQRNFRESAEKKLSRRPGIGGQEPISVNSVLGTLLVGWWSGGSLAELTSNSCDDRTISVRAHPSQKKPDPFFLNFFLDAHTFLKPKYNCMYFIGA